MQKKLTLIFALILITGLFGCAENTSPAPTTDFMPDNEILTYTRLDPSKTILTISRTGNIYIDNLAETFEAQNPDIQIVLLDITGGNSYSRPAVDLIEAGQAPDIMFLTDDLVPSTYIGEYFEDLSAKPYIERYDAAAMNRVAIDSYLYTLPGPSVMSAMVYNKTMFAEYGWSVPNTFDEFVALCLQIREDTDGEVEPWNPNAKYGNELTTAIEGFVYGQLFGGADNYEWYSDFCAGNAEYSEHMKPYYDLVETLVENNLLREEHFLYSATTRGKEFSAGKIAMINIAISDFDNDEYDFGFFPFPSTDGGIGYVVSNLNCVVGVPRKERSDNLNEAINRFLDYFSTAEGQTAFIGKSLMISNVKGTGIDQTGDLAAFKPTIEAGHIFNMLDFSGENGVPNFSLYSHTLELVKGGSSEQLLSKVDEKPYVEAASSTEPLQLAVSEVDFTVLETSFYICDMYKEKTDAAIALITNNEAYRGNLMRILKGALTEPDAVTLKPRSFANGSALIKVSMTGRQLLDALNKPMGNDKVADCIYAYSGLKCEIAPWNELGQRYLSVTLSDGSPLDETKLYTVAIWDGTVYDEFITERLDSYEGSFEQLMSEKLKADGSIKPADDGRIKLVWD